MTSATLAVLRSRHWLSWLGAALGLAALVWVLRRFNLDRFLGILARADWRFVALVPLAIMAEQLVWGWKWHQLLYRLRAISSLRLFGTIMAGYLLALLVPFGFGTVARSWLVARREHLKLTAVLATVALDRLTDGIVFAYLVPVALLSVVFPDPGGGIARGLILGGAGSLLLFALLLVALVAYRRGALTPDGWLARCCNRLPPRLAGPVQRTAASFAEGVTWPRESWRGIGIVLASVTIKLVAATHFLFAGLAVGVALEPMQYLFLVVFLGFLVILGHFARVAGSFVIGAIFALELFGVAEEQALAMVLIVEASSLLSVAGVGALSLWRQGVALGELRAAEVPRAGQCD
jgi:uncharacterized membrane protein YbhN (UPF0104 family)